MGFPSWCAEYEKRCQKCRTQLCLKVLALFRKGQRVADAHVFLLETECHFSALLGYYLNCVACAWTDFLGPPTT